jgi:hypothetical protein
MEWNEMEWDLVVRCAVVLGRRALDLERDVRTRRGRGRSGAGRRGAAVLHHPLTVGVSTVR